MSSFSGQYIESTASSAVVHGFHSYPALKQALEQLGCGKLNAMPAAK